MNEVVLDFDCKKLNVIFFFFSGESVIEVQNCNPVIFDDLFLFVCVVMFLFITVYHS